MAWPAAFASPSEGQVTVAKGRAVIQSYLEYATVMLLADVRDRGAGYDNRAEATMRFAMTRLMGFHEWASLFKALATSDRGAEVLGVDIHASAEASSAVARACQLLSVSAPTINGLLEACGPDRSVSPTAGPLLVDVASDLYQQSKTLAKYQLCFITAVRTIDDEAFEVRFQPLVGTGFIETKTRRFWREPPLTEGRVFFWDMARSAVPVPEWLGTFDDDARVVYLCNGRTQGDDWQFVSRTPAAGPMVLDHAPADMPVFLAEPTWQTPPPVSSRLKQTIQEIDEPHPDTQMLRMEDVENTIYDLMALKTQIDDEEDEHELTAEASLALTVLGSRSFMNYLELTPGTNAVLGRSDQHASFVVDDVKVSRKNTRVTVERNGRIYASDLGSTNGTRLNGKPLDKRPVPLRPLDHLQVGPVLLRVEPLDAARKQRVDRILDFPNDPDRDPLTGLLKPHTLGKVLKRERGERLTGVVVYIDRLSSIHASRGQEQADVIFRCVARLIMVAMAQPELCVRVGYGECLAVLRGDSAKAGVDMANLFLDQIKVWPTTDQVTVTAGVVEADADEPIDQWVQRARELTLRGSTGDWRVLTATSQKAE
jgi:GGDEF domain-containing protein